MPLWFLALASTMAILFIAAIILWIVNEVQIRRIQKGLLNEAIKREKELYEYQQKLKTLERTQEELKNNER